MKSRSSNLRGEKIGMGVTVRRKFDIQRFLLSVQRSVRSNVGRGSTRDALSTIHTVPAKKKNLFLSSLTAIPKFLVGLVARREIPSEFTPQSYELGLKTKNFFRRLLLEGLAPYIMPLGVVADRSLFGTTRGSYMLPLTLFSSAFISLIGVMKIVLPEISVDEIVRVSGPAKKAGICGGDRIISINGNSSMSSIKSLQSVLDDGILGELIQLKIYRKVLNELYSLDVDVIRDFVPMVEVEHTMLSGGIGYLMIREFSERTCIDTQEAIMSLTEAAKIQNGIGLEGIVVDLRGNLGGTLPSALDVAALFLKRGKVLMRVRRLHVLSLIILTSYLNSLFCLQYQSSTAAEGASHSTVRTVEQIATLLYWFSLILTQQVQAKL